MKKGETDNSKPPPKEKNYHIGHRERRKEFFIKNGIRHMHEHEVVELMLFCSIPRGDVNPLSHELVDRFGSLQGILDAKYEDLLKVRGVGENTAALFKLFKQIAQKYMKQYYSRIVYGDTTLKNFKRYCSSLFLGHDVESVYLFALDRKNRFVAKELLNSGTGAYVNFSEESVLKFARKVSAAHQTGVIMMAHNHPDGSCKPSLRDIESTRHILKLLAEHGCVLADSIVVGANKVCSMKEEGLML